MDDQYEKLTKEQISAIEFVRTMLLNPVLNLIESDPHQWSNRPCPTCRSISVIIGQKFGCEKLRIK